MVVYVCGCFGRFLTLWVVIIGYGCVAGCLIWVFLFLLVAAGLIWLGFTCDTLLCVYLLGLLLWFIMFRLAVCCVYCLYLIRLGVLFTAFAIFAFWVCGIWYLCLLVACTM